MPALPKIIFVENHFDVVNYKMITRLIPLLRQKGYELYYDESRPSDTLSDAIKGTSEDALAAKSEIESLKLNQYIFSGYLDSSLEKYHQIALKFPKKVSNLFKKAYYDHLNLKLNYQFSNGSHKLYQALVDNQFQYQGVDNEEGSTEAQNALLSPLLTDNQRENVFERTAPIREKDISSAYIESKKPFIARLGYAHLKPIQARILHQLKREEAENEFCFIFVDSKNPELETLRAIDPYFNEHWDDLQQWRIHLPMTLNVFNADENNQDQIIKSILNMVDAQSSKLEEYERTNVKNRNNQLDGRSPTASKPESPWLLEPESNFMQSTHSYINSAAQFFTVPADQSVAKRHSDALNSNADSELSKRRKY